MSWFDRRAFLGALGAAGLALAGCGFTPAYGPGGAAGALTGAVALSEPEDRAGYLLNRRIEERIGRAPAGRYRLETAIETDTGDFGTTSTGSTTRYRIASVVAFTLTDTATGAEVLRDSVESFTDYSATGSAVATLASERDARERLMVILADRIVDRLILSATDLPG
ncbi:secreted periplasmic protein [Roseivivax marinus]|uniref:Secreted periplasmic protein n=1 Tax=Roseivivax marinus TaxID=1379903 RepID=W4HM60_9RHOB|nr:LPS assembly lipoprotein LptE [Roseivivax marinus]ETW13483.1 secreted periplasmic protein [Roseivivax marinus]